ncbi:MAG TPA: 6-bladed beta-propeller [Chryseosolibacter sp.]
MSKNYSLFLSTFASALLPFILFLGFSKEDVKSPFLRNFSGNKLERRGHFEVDFKASKIKFDNDLFIYNYDAGQIIRFDTAGTFVNAYGNLGTSPGEFQVVTDYSVFNNTLKVLDLRRKSLSVFDLENSTLLSEIRLSKPFNKGSILSDSTFVITDTDSLNNTRFSVYNSAGKLLQKKLEYDDLKDGGFATDGILIKADDQFFHFCYHVSYFVSFDHRLQLKYRAKTVENHFILPPVIRDGENSYLSPEAKTLSYDGCADDAYIYILSAEVADNESRDDFDQNSPVDVYDSNTGRYLRTFYIPRFKGFKVRSIAKAGKGFYTIQGNSIIYYEERS